MALAALASGGGLAVALGVAAMVAPRLVEERIAAELAAAGLPGASFRVTRVDPSGVRVEDVVLGEDLRADAIDLELDLVARRASEVTIRGARWQVALDENALRESTPARLASLASRSGPDEGGGGPPVDRLRLEASEVVLAHRGGELTIAVEAEVDPRAARGVARLRSEHGELALEARERDGALALDVRDHEGATLALELGPEGEERWWSVRGEVPRALAALAIPHLAFAEAPRVELQGALRDAVWTLEHGASSIRLASARDGDDLEAHDVAIEASLAGELAPVLGLDVDARAEARHARWSDARFDAVAARASLRVDRADGGELRIDARRDVDASVGTFALGTGDGEVRVHDVSLALAPLPSRPLFRFADGVPRIVLSARAAAPRVRGAVRGQRVRARGHVDLALGPEPRLHAPLHIELATLTQPQSELTAREVQSAVRMSLDAEGSPRAAGTLRATRTAWRDVALGTTRGTIAISSERLALAFAGRATGAAPFHVDAWVGLEQSGGRVDVRVPPSQVGAYDPLHHATLAATGLRVLGRAGGEIHVGLGPRGRSSARLSLEGATVDDVEGRGTALGVRGTIVLAGLDPAVSADADRVTWTALSIADAVKLRAGSARLRLEPSGEVSVHDTELAIGGGTIRIAPFSVDLERPDVTLALAVEGVDVRRLAEVVSSGKVSGTGRLDGHVAVRLALGDEPRVELGRGTLRARGPGRIRIRELPTSSVTPTSVEVLQDGEWIQQRVLAALADFEYSRLALELGGEEGARTLHAHVAGRGARTPQELDLRLNVHGVQSALDHGLRFWQRGSEAVVGARTARRDDTMPRASTRAKETS